MCRILHAATLGIAVLWLVGLSEPVRAQDLENSQVEIAYEMPHNRSTNG
jgi:hypothetical protein